MSKLKKYKLTKKELKKLAYAKITTTNGSMVLKLYGNDTPNTVANFAHLVKKGFYDGLIFHRVIDGFMAQGGCPDGSGMSGAGHNIACECEEQENVHTRGAISMAHAGRDTGSSQFFICFVDTPHLDGEHTVFGSIQSDDEASFGVLDDIKQDDEIIKIEILESI
jgi:peptidyl-prolyl cis-trans isomerase B (cyclophilin B)